MQLYTKSLHFSKNRSWKSFQNFSQIEICALVVCYVTYGIALRSKSYTSTMYQISSALIWIQTDVVWLTTCNSTAPTRPNMSIFTRYSSQTPLPFFLLVRSIKTGFLSLVNNALHYQNLIAKGVKRAACISENLNLKKLRFSRICVFSDRQNKWLTGCTDKCVFLSNLVFILFL